MFNRQTIFRMIRLSSLLIVLSLTACGAGEDTGAPTTDGQGGSMARFMLTGGFLYTIAGGDLQIFNIADNPAQPVPFATVNIDRGIETLFQYNNHLYVGATDGVYIYENSRPDNPQYLAKFVHASSCDPVVVSGNYAYVTLRSGGNRCGTGVNSLDVIDITVPSAPVLVNSYFMQNPKGLAVADGVLFVCDDIAGLKVYNLDAPEDPEYIKSYTDINCYDLIPNQNTLIVSEENSIMQFDYTALELNQLSQISVSQQ